MALGSVAFLITEALLGAGLVLFNYVDKDASIGRAFYLSLHLLNTLLLLAALALTAWYSGRSEQVSGPKWPWAVAALPIAALVSVTGAIAALGDTLFPAASLAQGFHQDFSSAGNFLVRLRVLHPALALLAGAYFVGVAVAVLRSNRRGDGVKTGDRRLGPGAGATGCGRAQCASARPGLDADHALVAGGSGVDIVGVVGCGGKTAMKLAGRQPYELTRLARRAKRRFSTGFIPNGANGSWTGWW